MQEPNSNEVSGLYPTNGSACGRTAGDLLPLVYNELRRLAHARLYHEKPGQTLQPTALVHEAYLRILQNDEIEWQSRAHIFSAAAEAMRRIMVERARRLARIRHGGMLRRVALEDSLDLGADPDAADFLALNEALERLEARDTAMAKVVKMRYFAGLSVEDTARLLTASPRSVNRLWTSARLAAAGTESRPGRSNEQLAPLNRSRFHSESCCLIFLSPFTIQLTDTCFRMLSPAMLLSELLAN